MSTRDHLSFSGMLRRSDGRVMIIRDPLSALGHATWTHSFSGSPRPAEPLPAAVRRCAEKQLGVMDMAVEPLLPLLGEGMASGTGVAEVHPSYIVVSDDEPSLAGDSEVRWAKPLVLGMLARENPRDFSPLLVLHATRLPFFGGSPHAFTQTVSEERATG